MPKSRAAARSLVERDRGLVWHPYAALNGPAPYEVTGASGVRLHLRSEDGTRFEAIDGMSSWWSAIHGYRNPVLDEALRKQIDQFSHVMFGGLTHEPAVRLAEQLVNLAPEPLAHVFFADSGSVSVEVALKLAVQYQASAGRPRRQQFLALRGGYHGDTVGAMSVCDPIDGMHSAFPNLIPAQLFLQRPPKATLIDGRLVTDDVAVDSWVEAMEETILRHSAEIAGIIVEPILQGAGGMYVYAPRCLKALRRVATQHGILLIFDEIATGFGRTGKLFATEWAGIAPDVMCVGKALTGGYLTLAAMLCTAEVATIVGQSAPGVLLHGPTFMANPLACAVASASLGLLNGWESRVSRIGAALATALAPAASYSFVREVRVLGAVGVIELDGPVDVVAVTRAALERGVWLRPFRNLVYTMPPYVSSSQDITNIAEAIGGAIAQVHG
ncbi:adenosylmethionine--8-amino-7-oxononanoate transaminase [Cryobacterium sp. M15]|uniref:adenosylmethionine--8-amino-7-oxononanoate transaminase n=1 Tax=Cryobacterium sp. M15 TaxID=2048291 RepID=UPI000CE39AA8|nr:adenosylmethionine--8-amino-7-oxononanoate transaminase [Cryobacterium sp. M15]